MEHYIGLDVSLRRTAICIVDRTGRIEREGVVASDPEAIAACGFHFLSEAKMRWILEQLFVGNRLARGEARIVHGHHLDLRLIRSPIIVFASCGDNITPPQQALDWIVDTYADEQDALQYTVPCDGLYRVVHTLNGYGFSATCY